MTQKRPKFDPFERAALKHKVFKRDGFVCRYCDRSPTDEGWLEMDHLIPRHHRGSDHIANLVTACNTCNRDKNSRIRIPASMCESSKPDGDGFVTWKSWGGWSLRFDEHVAGLYFEARRYWIEIGRVHEEDWEEHMLHKTWCKAERVTFPCRREHEPLRSEWGREPLFDMDLVDFEEDVRRGLERDYERDEEEERLHQPWMNGPEAVEDLYRSIERNSTRHLPIVGNQNHNDLVRALGFCKLLVRPPAQRRSAA